jgi:hypothetical protein
VLLLFFALVLISYAYVHIVEALRDGPDEKALRDDQQEEDQQVVDDQQVVRVDFKR